MSTEQKIIKNKVGLLKLSEMLGSGSLQGGGPNAYFNSSCYVLPPAGYYGNVGRNTLTAPGFFDIDFAAHKVSP